MEDKIENLLSFCCEFNFGTVNLSDGEKAFCNELNDEIISLCQSMPESIQTDAILFFMRCFKASLGKELNFLRYFYAPAWSIIYWLIQSGSNDKELDPIDIANAKTAHAMAMLLHALDDHLCDGEISVTHIALLARSQAWMLMNKALNQLTFGIDRGEDIVQGFLNDYYSSISGREEIQSLDSYCNLFRMQMATWLIVPILVIKKIFTDEEFSDAVQTAYESFGIAWRLLDDVNDIQTDMMNGVHSSVYVCLSKNMKKCWDKDHGDKTDRNSGHKKVVLVYILKNNIIHKIKKRICSELESAARVADRFNLTGLADEYHCLVRPLKGEQDLL